FFHVTSANIGDIPVTISRTGYTGDLGYELWVPAECAARLWDTLIAGGTPYGITPAGMLALDVARIEAGLLLIDVDYVSAQKASIESQKSSPYELGLGWTVKLNSDGFVGRSALAAEKDRGPDWQFCGLDIQWDSLERLYGEVGLPPRLPTAAWRTSTPVYTGGEQIGYATSGCWSPTLKKYIALAHIEAQHACMGGEVWLEVTVEHRRKQAAAKIVETPFFDPERKRG
ncbi:MAG: aminomethyltransferase family protein, partial [Gemmatimonadales bacterium]